MTIRSFWLRLHVASVCNKRIYKMVLRTGTPLQYASVQEPILGLFTLFEKPASLGICWSSRVGSSHSLACSRSQAVPCLDALRGQTRRGAINWLWTQQLLMTILSRARANNQYKNQMKEVNMFVCASWLTFRFWLLKLAMYGLPQIDSTFCRFLDFCKSCKVRKAKVAAAEDGSPRLPIKRRCTNETRRSTTDPPTTRKQCC